MKKENQIIDKNCVVPEYNSPYIKVFDLQYEQGKHYFDATRRNADQLLATKSTEEFKTMIPDAVSCAVILEINGQEPMLYLTKEYRYPTGRFLLSVPSGLIDEADKAFPHPAFHAAERELKEETGLSFDKNTDEMISVNPLLFCSPGMTDECTAFTKIVLHRDEMPLLQDQNGVGTEQFTDSMFVTKEKAREFLLKGTDESGIYYSAVTWIALMVFVSDLW